MSLTMQNAIAHAQQDEMVKKFAADVHSGLSKEKKTLSSLYFYDDIGSDIYAQITECQDYYLTRSEFDLLSSSTNQVAISDLVEKQTSHGNGFNVVELGAGDGRKTTVLLNHFLERGLDFTYMPIDISSGALTSLKEKMGERFSLRSRDDMTRSSESDLMPLRMQTVHADNLDGLKAIISMDQDQLASENLYGNRTNVVLFLGSSIGNMTNEQAAVFLKSLYDSMQEGDVMCCGFDLAKNPERMIAAYSDSDGLTAEFNYNLLRRMNRELGANFNVEDFQHHATYLPGNMEMQSWVVSKKDQDVYVKAIDQTFHFRQWECIHTESSHKYNEPLVEKLARDAGFDVHKHCYDPAKDYLFSLWTKPVSQ